MGGGRVFSVCEMTAEVETASKQRPCECVSERLRRNKHNTLTFSPGGDLKVSSSH